MADGTTPKLGHWQHIEEGGSLLGSGIAPANFGVAARKHGRHFARYLHAGAFVAGKRVLDAASGAGYGSAYMAQWAKCVLGVELDEQLLAGARETYRLQNVEFIAHDMHEPIPAEKPFDVVVSFETLEHVRDPARCAVNLAACLADDGLALVSVPNGPMELAGGGDTHHMSHFSADDLRQLLDGCFEDVELFGQVYHRGFRHYLRKWTGRGKHHAANYRFLPDAVEEAKTFLAHCRRPKRR